MQALTPGHHFDKRDKPYIQSPAKPNITGNRFRIYPEVTTDGDNSSEEFTQDQQDQFKWSWSRSRADDPYQYD